jgi:NarL family two-component system response regulator LiaR
MSVIRVLLADDHAIVREATAEIVDHQPDMQVVGHVGTGEEAVALVQELQPDVAVMDIAMPHLNGVEATRQIIAECPSCRVLVLTAHDEERYVVQSLQAGALGYLLKTADLDELLEAIRATARGDAVLPPAIAALVMRHLARKEPLEEATHPLTDRELEVLQLVAQGLTNCEIAQQLYVSVRTVEAHLTHTYNKLGVGSRTEAVVCAMQQGWFQPPYEQQAPLAPPAAVAPRRSPHPRQDSRR